MQWDWKPVVDVAIFAVTLLNSIVIGYFRHQQVTRDAIVALEAKTREAIVSLETKGSDRVDRLVLDFDARCDVLSERTAGAEGTLNVVQEALRHLPGHQDMKRVHERIDRNAEATAEINGKLDGIIRQNGLILQQLLDQARGTT